jgi:hypothetical protein
MPNIDTKTIVTVVIAIVVARIVYDFFIEDAVTKALDKE